MDLSKLINITELKSMAYDQIAAKEQAEHNLRLINQRIVELTPPPEEKTENEYSRKENLDR